MDPPSLREIELETLLRERDAQVAELTDEVNHLRKYLVNQPEPSRSDLLTLPPTLLAILQQHIFGRTGENAQGTTSSTMTAALMQRARILQEENDELYELLRISETGKLKEEVHHLKNSVAKLERALKESHTAISALTDDLEKSLTELQPQARTESSFYRDSHSPPPMPSQRVEKQENGTLKTIPTGPRAHKKPRLNSQPSPARSNISLPATASNSAPHSNSARQRRDRERSPRDSRRTPVKDLRMDVDEDLKRTRSRTDSRDRSRERARERERDRERDRDRDRRRDSRDHKTDRDRPRDREREHEKNRDRHKEKEGDRSRRNGTQGGRGSNPSGSGSGNRKNPRGYASQDNGDRTLAERIGL